MKNYKVDIDGVYTSIGRTNQEVNDFDIFPTFTQAKKAIYEHHLDTIAEYKDNIKRIKRMKKSEI